MVPVWSIQTVRTCRPLYWVESRPIGVPVNTPSSQYLTDWTLLNRNRRPWLDMKHNNKTFPWLGRILSVHGVVLHRVSRKVRVLVLAFAIQFQTGVTNLCIHFISLPSSFWGSLYITSRFLFQSKKSASFKINYVNLWLFKYNRKQPIPCSEWYR